MLQIKHTPAYGNSTPQWQGTQQRAKDLQTPEIPTQSSTGLDLINTVKFTSTTSPSQSSSHVLLWFSLSTNPFAEIVFENYKHIQQNHHYSFVKIIIPDPTSTSGFPSVTAEVKSSPRYSMSHCQFTNLCCWVYKFQKIGRKKSDTIENRLQRTTSEPLFLLQGYTPGWLFWSAQQLWAGGWPGHSGSQYCPYLRPWLGMTRGKKRHRCQLSSWVDDIWNRAIILSLRLHNFPNISVTFVELYLSVAPVIHVGKEKNFNSGMFFSFEPWWRQIT